MALASCLASWAQAPPQDSSRLRSGLPEPEIPGALGVNIHFTDPRPGEMEQLAAGGFRWIRMDFAWGGIEREKGHFDFGAYDHLMDALDRRGIRPIFILDYGNDLYQEGSPRSPDARAAFARFTAAAVRHFHDRGILWEMWNEPNIGFWKPAPNVDEYVALGLETGKAIREAQPNEWFIGPGMSGVDLTFLEKCLQGGMLKYWDAVSVHPYRNLPPETAADDFRKMRDLIDRYAPKGKHIPIISSEWGYSELYPGLTLEKQGKYLPREYLSNLMNGVILSIWYDWHDDGTDPKETEHHFGVVYNDYRPKPAYHAVQTLSRTLGGLRYNKRLALDSPDDYCLLFSSGAKIGLAAWTTASSPHEATIPASAGAFRVVDYTGGASSAQAGEGGLRIRLNNTPQYLIPEGANALLSAAEGWRALPPYVRADSAADIDVASMMGGDWPEADRPRHGKYTVQIGSTSRSEGAASDEEVKETRRIARVEFDLGAALPPQSSLAQDLAFSNRGETPARLREVLTVEGLGSIAQEAPVYPGHPLIIAPLSPVGGVLPVRIENPTGAPFTGRVSAGPTPDQSVPLRLADGQTEATVRLPMERSAAGEYRARIAVEERAQGETAGEPKADAGTEARTEAGGEGGAWTPVVSTPALSFTPLAEGDASGCRVEPDGDPKVGSKLSCERVSPPAGLPVPIEEALRVRYRFDPGWKFLRLPAEGAQREPLTGAPYALGAWVYGDGSADLLRARFADSTGQTFQPDAGRIDWKGWRYVTFPLTGEGGHWGGADDGVVHGPIHLDTLALVDSPGGRGGEGTVYFAGFTLVRRDDRPLED